jgi:GNAT superfamily N-acetyltransferase
MAHIIEYDEKYLDDFRRLNIEWLEKYGLLEQPDLDVLDNPRAMILDNGGYIYLAADDGTIVGTAALVNEHDDVYELAKMAVAPAFRGKGIGKLLIECCLQKAAEIKAKKILLYSNSQLATAIAMYEKYGFVHIPVVDSPFVTADVKMELSL